MNLVILWRRKLDAEKICKFAYNGTLPRVIILPEFVIDYVEIASRTICISKEKIAADYFAVIIPLKEELDKEIGRECIDSSAIYGVGRETSVWQVY